jgi:lysophospholipase L1-like esterase
MPLISRDVPAFTPSGINTRANNASYDDYCWLSAQTYPVWIAYDLSGVEVHQRQQVVVRWVTDHWQYFEGVARAPGDYTIQGSSAPGGSLPDESSWETLLTITGNIYHSRQHIVNLGGRSWFRLHVTQVSSGTSLNVNIDVHNAHLGAEDTWLFTGDSLTAHGMQIDTQDDQGDIGPNFAVRVNELLPAFFPAMENAGRGYWTAQDGAGYIPGWMSHYPGRYVAISFGTNDAIGNVSPEDFYDYYQQIVDAVLGAGKIPVIPTIAWLRQEPASSRIPALNAAVAQLKEDYIPEGQDESLILDGPDLWTLFSANQGLISDDNVHPNALGYDAFREVWANRMIEVVYGQIFADGLESGDTSAWSHRVLD